MAQSKVLLVDDNSIYLSRLLKLLDEEKIDNQIFVAGNYDEAVSLIANEKPQIIFLDDADAKSKKPNCCCSALRIK